MSQTLYNKAIDLYQAGQMQAAANTLLTILQSNPKHADSLHLLGIVYYQSNQIHQAVSSIKQAVDIAPRNINYLNNYGLTLKANGQFTDALQAYQQAILLNPKDVDVQLNIANLMMQLERFEEAAGYYRRLLRVYKQHQTEHEDIRLALCNALSLLGNHAYNNGQFVQAEACFAEAVQFNNKDSALFYNLGNATRELGKTSQALAHFKTSIQLNPNDADAYNNLGNIYRELGQLDEAIESYEKALVIDPNLHHAKVHLIHQKQHACNWTNFDEDIKAVRNLVQNVPTAQVSPFAFLAMPTTTLAEQLRCANNWIESRYKGLKGSRSNIHLDTQQPPKNKLNIAYLSSDFRLHPLAFLITELIEQHDRSTFEVIGYSFGKNDQSKARARFESAFDNFHDIRHLSEIEAAKKIQADGIDILIDLTGFTQTSRSGIMLLRPANIHVSWLGFAGTMGFSDIASKTPLFDYILTDETISPKEHAPHYAEKLCYLPCYQPNDRQRPIGEPSSREACALPSDAFVFCSFNQSFKITPDIFTSWMRILSATPNSVLWLLECNTTAKTNLMNTAESLGIKASRLIFAPRVSLADHLARHRHADLFLDTQPYNAHTTCSDALWMGVPVLTCIGDTFASRVASSLLKATGLASLITTDLAQYEQEAISYANNPESLNGIKAQLIESKESAILFDTPTFTKTLEKAYTKMWQDANLNNQ